MENLKEIIANNLVTLRRQHNMTQLELAEALNYSDKAISKWERGESVPDVAVLKQMAVLFGVTLDYLVEEEHRPEERPIPPDAHLQRNRRIITGISVVLVWLIATTVFINFNLLAAPQLHNMWQLFVCAVPVSFIVWLVFNSLWFDRKWNFLIVSLLVWSSLAALYLSLLSLSLPIWQVFVVGVPAQIIILLWSGIHPRDLLKRKEP